MPIILYLILLLLTLSNWITVWLLFKLLPTEKKEEVKKAMERVLHPLNEGKVFEWIEPKSGEKQAEEKILNELHLA